MDERQYMEEQPVPETQEYAELAEQVEQEETPATEQYQLPFADSIYETPYTYPQPVKKESKKEKSKAGWVILSVILAVVLATASSIGTAVLVNSHWENRWENLMLTVNDKHAAMQAQIDGMQGSVTVVPSQPMTVEGQLTPGQVYAQNVDAVVAVECIVEQHDEWTSYESFGSGFIISADGYVVSNYHVVQGASQIEVTTPAGENYDAVLVGYDETNDIALLKVEAEELPYVTLGSSSDLLVGDQVLAIGNPLGELTSTLTVGYVSAKDRVVTTDGSAINMIQTDTAINAGNSGGPLFNMYGEVVGITTAKFSGTASSGASIEGIGFAIPMDDVIGMIEDLRDFGYVTGAYLGVMVRDVDASAQAYGLPAGAYVEEVTPGFAAEAAGLHYQDIIVELGGYEITSVTELTRMLRKFEPGETISITVYRAGQEVQLSITLDEKPRDDEQSEILMPGDEGFEEWYKEFIEDYFE